MENNMLFNSYIFLLFLPIVWAVYFLLNHFNLFKLGSVSLIIASFVFYGYEDPKLVFLLGFSIIANYFLYLGLKNEKSGKALRVILLVLGIIVNLSLLFYFKYFNFTVSNINKLFGAGISLRNIALPLGISFYSFQQLSFIIDSYKKTVGDYGFIEYALFVSFFPQLVAGPIVLHSEMIPQFQDENRRRINTENLQMGMEYFVIGFAKKVIVADTFSRICDAGFENIYGLNSLSAFLTSLAFTMQIYFDFSGYCDMALGLGRMFNIELPINFDSPYRANNITEFWKHWHMTLTRFLTNYIYIPLGGNRRGLARTCINIMIVYAVSGLWHGSAWTFVIWGILHGIAMVVDRVGKNFFRKIPGWIMWTVTFLFVNFAWVFFRADYVGQAARLLRRVLIGGMGGINSEMVQKFADSSVILTVFSYSVPNQTGSVVLQLILAAFFVGSVAFCLKAPSSHTLVNSRKQNRGWYIYLGLLFGYSILCLSQVSKFIYFNF